jgi:6-pyruvoyltetrahydropterin/6-carboxytetrahydropterin synthase
MFKARVSTEFSAAHSLRGYKGKCEELHGHNWKVEVTCAAVELNKLGMVVDFHILKEQLNKITAKLDHKHLNRLTVFKKVNPTSENIARYIFEQLVSRRLPLVIEEVTVWESNNSSATFCRE